MYRGMAGLLLALAVPAASADDLFVTGVTVNGGSEARKSYDTVTDLLNSLSTKGLKQTNPAYTETSATTATLYVRGLPAEAAFATNATTLRFRVPSLGIDESFTGSDRDDSRDRFEDFLKANGDDILKRMLKELARVSPVDPIAGNPASLMSQMGVQDFGNVMEADNTSPGSTTGGVAAAFGAGLRFDRYSSGGFDQNVTTLPLSYRRDIGNGYQLTLDMPINWVDTQGASTYNLSVGGALRVPVTPQWSLTPALRIGAGGSEDLGGGATMYSGSLTSRYTWDFGDYRLGLTDMLGLYRTNALDVGDYHADYDLSNRMFRNALDLSGPLRDTFLGSGAIWRAWIIDTRFYGSELYSENQQEFGIAATTRMQVGGSVIDKVSLGLTYLSGDNDVSGFKVNFGYRF
ncbi:hypothetical protein EV699_10183 [Plasticicumulans lactativorans]|uniref:Uncharacterized protein n=2 Tax=Plasticicumulans lactativorans TaxID=1133106 RepID=A0A4R2L975_9GAMM|nr:hypothetical protein EV699_10183 [Plasticicumulans lactativorans]